MKPITFINLIRKSDYYIQKIYSEGGCYQFSKILKKLYPTAQIFISYSENHTITKIDGIYYDINGYFKINKMSFRPIESKDLIKLKKWRFRKHNLIKPIKCPYCKEELK